MLIKKLDEAEFEEAMKLVWDVFLEFEAPDYSPEGTQEFKNFIQLPSILEQQYSNHLQVWGAYKDNEIVGVIATRNETHICLLFVKKEFHKQGIARMLFEIVKTECKQQDNAIEQFTVNSSPFAVEVYHRLGFVDIDLEQVEKGIRFTPMKFAF